MISVRATITEDDFRLIQKMRDIVSGYYSNYSKSLAKRDFVFLGKIDERFGTVGSEGDQFRVDDAAAWAEDWSEAPW